MPYKYNISSLINEKINKKDEDENKNSKNKNEKTITHATTEKNDSLKNKQLSEVIEDLENIEISYSTKDHVDAPESLNLTKVDVPNKTEEELIDIAKNSLKNKYNSNKVSTLNSFESKINKLINEQKDEKSSLENKKQNINSIYDSAITETEAQALKRGLARSSIVINKLSDLNENKAIELSNLMSSINNKLNENAKEISNLEKEKDIALQNLDIEYAIELEDKLIKVKSDYEKSKQNAIEFNNNIEKLNAEYKLKLDKQKLDKQESLTKLEDEYKTDYTKSKIKEAQFEYLKNYFDSLDKEYAMNLFLTNKELKDILGENYSRMYKHLTNK